MHLEGLKVAISNFKKEPRRESIETLLGLGVALIGTTDNEQES